MIHLSDAARRRIGKFLAANPSGIGIYVAVTRAGCAGYGYHIEIAEAVGADQHSFAYPGFQVVVDKADLPLIDGLTLDVKKQGLNEFFSFANPQAESTCGCGSSFRVG